MTAGSALARWGWDAEWQEAWNAGDRGGAEQPGRVVQVQRVRAVVETAIGTVEASADTLPVVGDWVAVEPAGDGTSHRVAAVLAARSELARVDEQTGERQPLAANIDVVFCVHPLDRAVEHGRLDRELVLAWDSGAVPVVVLTKADTVADPRPAAAAVRDRAPGVEVIVTSAVRGDGVDELAHHLRPRRTGVLFGASGAGKSTLANRLLGEERLATGEVRARDRAGRHTTTVRSLILVPGGGVLLDTPGLRSLGVGDASEGLSRAFPEVEEVALECRFADCAHEVEPGCAVVEAVESGRLDAARVEAWLRLLRAVESAPPTRRRR